MADHAPDAERVPAPVATSGHARTQHLGDGLGLRERKKRETRQRLSDTATQMFLDRGFDQVRVSEVAAACDVSEKTVYNYFPTKESLLLDREDAQTDLLRRALATGAGSVTDALVDALAADTEDFEQSLPTGPQGVVELQIVERFTAMVQASPTLRAAQVDMMERHLQVVAHALAARTGTDPEAAEQQVAAAALVGLMRVQLRAIQRYADGTRSPAQVREAVLTDIRRAAAVLDRGLGQELGQLSPSEPAPRPRTSASDTTT